MLFIPTADDPALLREEFIGVPEAIAELGIPVIDLLDTFEAIPNRETIRVADNDRHPNAAGHRLLAERLRQAIKDQPAVADLFFGTSS